VTKWWEVGDRLSDEGVVRRREGRSGSQETYSENSIPILVEFEGEMKKSKR